MKDEKTGKFIQSNIWGKKSLRSMKLTDECWDNLDKIAKSKGINRSELIEQLSRELLSQDNTLEKVESFIEKKKANYGNNPSQRGKEFSRDSRDWKIFNEFVESVE